MNQERFFKGQTADISGSHPNGIFRLPIADKRDIGSQRVRFNFEKSIIRIPCSIHQFIDKRQIHIVI